MIGPHVSPADAARMTELAKATEAALEADPEVARLRAAYLERLDAFDAARHALDDASYALAQAEAARRLLLR